jgi:hypothetical protein
MVSLRSLLLYVATATALTTVHQVIDDITVLDNNVKALTTQISLYTGGILAATPQLTSLTAVYLSLLKGVTDSGLLPPTISSPDAMALIQHVNKTLAIDNPIAVKTLESKKELFKEAGLKNAIVGAL